MMIKFIMTLLIIAGEIWLTYFIAHVINLTNNDWYCGPYALTCFTLIGITAVVSVEWWG